MAAADDDELFAVKSFDIRMAYIACPLRGEVVVDDKHITESMWFPFYVKIDNFLKCNHLVVGDSELLTACNSCRRAGIYLIWFNSAGGILW